MNHFCAVVPLPAARFTRRALGARRHLILHELWVKRRSVSGGKEEKCLDRTIMIAVGF
jgi:hypothetical protein